MAEKNFENQNALEGMNLEPDTTEHELVVDNTNENDYYNVDNEDVKSEESSSTTSSDDKNDTNDYSTDDDIPDKSIQKKRTKLQKILTVVLSVLVILLTIGVVLYFMGFFNEEEEKKPVPKPTIEKKVTPKTIEFKSRDINTQRLNKKLNNLTKYDDEIIKRKKEEEAKRKALEKEKREAEEEQKRKEEYEKAQNEIEKQKQLLEKEQKDLESQKEELVMMKEKLLNEVNEKKAELSELMQEKRSLDNGEENNTQETTHNAGEMPNSTNKDDMVEEQKNGNTFLSFINVAVLKTSLKKSYLKNIEKINTNIYLCRDNKNHIEIYVGPFEMNEHREETLNKFLNSGFKEAMQIDLTQEEFNKRCKY